MKLKKSIIIFIVISACNPLNVLAANKKAAGISLRNQNGDYVTVGSINKNKNIILSFWATYCSPCKAEMPKLIELEKKYSAAKKLQLVFVSIDNESERNSVLKLLNKMGIYNECLFDIYQLSAKKYIPDLKIPAFFLINRYGYIVYEAQGGKAEFITDLEKAIQLLQ